MNVLIVEDDPVRRIQLEAFLTNHGYTVAAAESLAAGMRLLEDWTPDVAVLDFDLQPDTSERIADALAERGAPFVFLIGWIVYELPERHRHRPFLRKPYRWWTLKAELERAVRAT